MAITATLVLAVPAAVRAIAKPTLDDITQLFIVLGVGFLIWAGFLGLAFRLTGDRHKVLCATASLLLTILFTITWPTCSYNFIHGTHHRTPLQRAH